MTAMTAATIDQLSDGRMLLGIGSSGPQVAEGWHGQRFARQLQRTREYVAVVRMALARERVEFDGETLELPLPDGPGKALKLTIAPVQERIPIYIAAIGPKNTTLAAEIADGWLPTLFSPEHVGEFRPLLEEGFARGRRRQGLRRLRHRPHGHRDGVATTSSRARDAMRHYVALYVGGMGSRKQNFYNALVQRYGFEDAAREVQDLYLEGRKDEAAAALPGELIDTVALVGPADLVRERLAVYREAGVGTLMISPHGLDVRGKARAAARRRRAGVGVTAARGSARAAARRGRRAGAGGAGARVRRDLPRVDAARLDRSRPRRRAGPTATSSPTPGAASPDAGGSSSPRSRSARTTRRRRTSGSCSSTRRAGARGSRARCCRWPKRRCGRAGTPRAAVDAARARPPSGSTRAAGWARDGRREWHPWVGLEVVGVRPRPVRVLLGAFGDPGHAFPMLALGCELVARGHEVGDRDLEALARGLSRPPG